MVCTCTCKIVSLKQCNFACTIMCIGIVEMKKQEFTATQPIAYTCT